MAYDSDQAGVDASQVVKTASRPGQLPDEQLYVYFRDEFLKDSAHSEEWREEARKADDFINGDQWEPDAFKRMVRDQKKQPVCSTFTATPCFTASSACKRSPVWT